MTNEEMLEVTKIYSVAGMPPHDQPLIRHRPFRSPHHTISHAGLVGGGRLPRPGEITLAHRGLLFLDELPEFGSQSLETLRQPLEDRVVTITRVNGSLTYPANFMLIGAMNPCRCGLIAACLGGHQSLHSTFKAFKMMSSPLFCRAERCSTDTSSIRKIQSGDIIAQQLILF